MENLCAGKEARKEKHVSIRYMIYIIIKTLDQKDRNKKHVLVAFH